MSEDGALELAWPVRGVAISHDSFGLQPTCMAEFRVRVGSRIKASAREASPLRRYARNHHTLSRP